MSHTVHPRPPMGGGWRSRVQQRPSDLPRHIRSTPLPNLRLPQAGSEALCAQAVILQIRRTGGTGGGVGVGARSGAPPRAARAGGRGAPRVLRPHAPLQVPHRLRGRAAAGLCGRPCRMQGCRSLGWDGSPCGLVSLSAGVTVELVSSWPWVIAESALTPRRPLQQCHACLLAGLRAPQFPATLCRFRRS